MAVDMFLKIDTIQGESHYKLKSTAFDFQGISGGAGNDIVVGTDDNDILIGGPGSDTLLGGQGDDILIGGNGRDTLIDGNGRDTLIGGNGADTFALVSSDDSSLPYLGEGYAIIEDFNRGDIIALEDVGRGDFYSLASGNWAGEPDLDTGIFFQGDLIGVVADNTNISFLEDFIFV